MSLILIVDDIPQNLELLESKLKNKYYNVIKANSGEEALELLKTHHPDLILSDVMMPGISGYELCAQLRENDKRYIPILLITAANIDNNDYIQGLNVGADDFLNKPLQDTALFSRISSLIKLKKSHDEIYLRNKFVITANLDNSEKARENVLNEAKVLLIDDDESSSLNAKKFLEEYSCVVDNIVEPQEALEKIESDNKYYKLILINIDFEGENNLTFCSRISELLHDNWVPILILVDEIYFQSIKFNTENSTMLQSRNFGDENNKIAQLLDIGVNDYIITPVDQYELKARCTVLLSGKKYYDLLLEYQNEQSMQSYLDNLTGVFNRNYFDLYYKGLLTQKRSFQSVVVLLIDIDKFKIINDTYGHSVGDKALTHMANVVKYHLDSSDLIARYGGEEFIIIFNNILVEEAMNKANKIKLSVANSSFLIDDDKGEVINLTISIGVSSTASANKEEIHDLIKHADEALYKAKDSGRNCVKLYKKT